MANKAAVGESVGTDAFALHCRGEVRLFCGDTDCTPRSKKGRALLAVLAAEQRPLSRVKIIDLLWSDRREEQARASLRTLLADIKEQFNSRFDDLLVVDRERVALASGVRTDLTDPSLARSAGELFEGLDHIDPELDEWLRVERERWASSGMGTGTAAAVAASAPARERRVHRPVLLIAVLALVVAAAALLAWRPWVAAPEPVLAVLKFRDITGKNALLADGLAEQLRIELAQYPPLGIVAAESSEADLLQGKDARTIADLLDATHLLEGRILPVEGQVQLNLRLIEGDTGKTVWTMGVEASGPAVVMGPNPIVPAIATLVSDVATQAAPKQALLADAQAYQLLFKARSLMNYEADNGQEAREILLQILARYPNFVPALVSAAECTMEMSDHTAHRGLLPLAEARRQAARFAQRAIDVAPNYGPAYGAMAAAYMDTDAMVPYQRRALELSPGSDVEMHNWARVLAYQGNWAGALEQQRRAARLDPLGAVSQWALAEALVNNGRKAEARQVLDRFFARAVTRTMRLQMTASTEIDLFGDWSRAYVAGRLALKEAPDDTWTLRINLWPTLLLYGADPALPFAGAEDSLPYLILTDDEQGVVSRVRSFGAEFWRIGYETSAAAHYLLSKNRADALVAAYDSSRAAGMARDSREFLIPELVVALRRQGRMTDAARLVRAVEKQTVTQKGVAPARAAIGWAITHALAGRREAAIRAMRYAHENIWWTASLILDHPYNLVAFESLRSDPHFIALVRDYDRWVERERKELVRQARESGLTPPAPTAPPRAILRSSRA